MVSLPLAFPTTGSAGSAAIASPGRTITGTASVAPRPAGRAVALTTGSSPVLLRGSSPVLLRRSSPVPLRRSTVASLASPVAPTIPALVAASVELAALVLDVPVLLALSERLRGLLLGFVLGASGVDGVEAWGGSARGGSGQWSGSSSRFMGPGRMMGWQVQRAARRGSSEVGEVERRVEGTGTGESRSAHDGWRRDECGEITIDTQRPRRSHSPLVSISLSTSAPAKPAMISFASSKLCGLLRS
jgi:hypothetical protein